MVKWTLLVLASTALLSGCASRWDVALDYSPEPLELPGLASKTFSIEVVDQRHFVVTQGKHPSYLGKYKGPVGDAWDVRTDDGVALAEHLRTDLREELQALQMIESASAPAKRVRVHILDWNFSANVDARYWYTVDISVSDADGRQIGSSVLREDKIVDGSVLNGAKWSLEEDVPELYDALVQKLVRENPDVLAALRQ